MSGTDSFDGQGCYSTTVLRRFCCISASRSTETWCVKACSPYDVAVSFLDLPDLASLAEAYPALVPLVNDPILNHERLWIVAPSRVSHSLFGTSSAGLPFRPTFPDLVHRGIIRGLGIERRWRDGLYVSSSLVRVVLRILSHFVLRPVLP